ncbi:MAG: hypothetical protein ACK4GN_08845 [Runella sp.]
MKKISNSLAWLYLIMVLFVVFHNTKYNLEMMFQPPYILYVILAGLGFMVIRHIASDSTKLY